MSYETIEIELPPELQDKLIEVYVQTNLSGASIDAFYANFSTDEGNISDQLYAAILNEMIVNALKDEMNRMEIKEEE